MQALFREMDPDQKDMVAGFERALKKKEDQARKWVKRMRLLGSDLETVRKAELDAVRRATTEARRAVHESSQQAWLWCKEAVERVLGHSVSIIKAREASLESVKEQLARSESQIVAERQRFQGRIADLDSLLAAANRTIKEKEEDIVGLKKEVSRLNTVVTGLETALQEERERREGAEREIEGLNKTIEELKESEAALYALQVRTADENHKNSLSPPLSCNDTDFSTSSQHGGFISDARSFLWSSEQFGHEGGGSHEGSLRALRRGMPAGGGQGAQGLGEGAQ